jgi:hypothetical protein
MITRSRPMFTLALIAALVAGVWGYARHWPHRFPLGEPSHEAGKAASPPPGIASAPMPPPAPAAAPSVEPPARMTAAQQAAFEAWLIKTYLGCWKPAPSPADADPFVAQVRLAFNPDGSLAKPAKLVNPPSDPALKPQAKSVMLAVQNCNPLPVPAQYRPFYEQWKTKTIHFNPQVAAR